MDETEAMKIARDMLVNAQREGELLDKLRRYEETLQKIKQRIKKEKFLGNSKTLSNDELAHNGALLISCRIIENEIKKQEKENG